MTYKHTVRACFVGCVVQAIINNFVPLLFTTFLRQDLATKTVIFFVSFSFASAVVCWTNMRNDKSAQMQTAAKKDFCPKNSPWGKSGFARDCTSHSAICSFSSRTASVSFGRFPECQRRAVCSGRQQGDCYPKAPKQFAPKRLHFL